MVTVPHTHPPSPAPDSPPPGPGPDGVDVLSNRAQRAAGPLLGAGLLVLLALLTTGGVLGSPPTQTPNSWVDAVLILLAGAGLAGLIITWRRGGGTLSALLFGALALLSALSIVWSVAPDQTWEESGRLLAYLGVFLAGLVIARRSRGDSAGAVLAITVALGGLCAWALAVKVFDLHLYGQPLYGPLLSPFGYWNATGVLGACAIPGALWIASRSGGSRLSRGVGVAVITLAVTVVALTYSRSAIAAAVCGGVIPLLFLASRRRAVAMLALGVLAAVPVCLFGLTSHAITADAAGSIYNGSSTIAAHRAGTELLLGAICLGALLVIGALAAGLSGWLDHHPQPVRRLAWVDRGLTSIPVVVVALLVIYLLVNARGPGGEISHVWNSLTSAKGAAVGGGVDRLSSVANSRSTYWRQAIAVGDHHLLAGAGVGAFDPAYLRYPQAKLSPPGFTVTHAHGYGVETYATLGLLGLAVNLALLLAWCRDAGSSVLRRAGAPAVERDARWALIGVVIAFGVSSLLDWTWFFPGVAIPALVAAGWISGLSGLRRTAEAPVGPAGPARPAGPPPPRPISARPGAILALTLLALVSLAGAWESLAPLRSVQSDNAAQIALEAGQGGAALSDARSATHQDPLSATARDQLGAVYGGRGEAAQERQELVKATQIQPHNPQPFSVLGQYLLCQRDYPGAQAALNTAVQLDVNPSASQFQLLKDADDLLRVPRSQC